MACLGHKQVPSSNLSSARTCGKSAPTKENSYKVGVCFFQVGVQIRRQAGSELNYYLFSMPLCWIAQGKIHNASVLMPLMLIVYIGNLSLLRRICYNMKSTIHFVHEFRTFNTVALDLLCAVSKMSVILDPAAICSNGKQLSPGPFFPHARHYYRWIETVCGRSQAASS